MAMTAKIIVLGHIGGQLQAAFAKLSALHAKNTFSFALVAGNLFAGDDQAVTDLLAGTILVPLPTYFTVGTAPLPERIIEKLGKGEEICVNLHFLGKRSTIKTTEGVKIVVLGGQNDTAKLGGLSEEQHSPVHTVGDAKSLHGANSADILLTTLWPASIRKGSSNTSNTATDPDGHEYIAALCSALRPRYHFTVSPDAFFEREPFHHNSTYDPTDVSPVTRFISVAPFGNAKKQKYLYAFTLQIPRDASAAPPLGTTASPFMTQSNGQKRGNLEVDHYSRYDRDIDHRGKRSKGRRGERQQAPGPSECFFCLSNPNLSTHLISSIGDDAYLTIAKGPLTTPNTYVAHGLGFSCHALIIPLTHSPTLAGIANEDGAREKTFAEMTRFKNNLQSMVAQESRNVLGAVTYEISKGNGVHTHWQFLPVAATTITKGLVEAAFRVEAENNSYLPFTTKDPGIGEGEGDFFRVWMWTPPSSDKMQDESESGMTRCISMPFDYKTRFSLQFGRTVLAKLLGLENRVQWRACAQNVEEEMTEIKKFKESFKAFDFTL